jgi:hypothetical protein
MNPSGPAGGVFLCLYWLRSAPVSAIDLFRIKYAEAAKYSGEGLSAL